MTEFQSMFMKSKGQPIAYQGNTLVMCDYFPKEGATKFRLVIETCNGNPIQQDSASAWTADRGQEHRTAEGLFRTSLDGLAPWRDIEPPGKWRQAVSMRLVFKNRKGEWQEGAGEGNDGRFVVDGKAVSGRQSVVFWQSKDWNMVEFKVVGDATAIAIHNAWDCGNGTMHSGHNGAAMIVEPLPNGRRYRCNDGFADDDFDDIVFRLERVS